MMTKLFTKAFILAFLISVVGILGTYFLSIQVNDQLKRENHLKLQNIAKQVSIRFQDAIDISLNDLQALQAFYSVNQQDKFQSAFDHYMHILDIENRDYIQALSWVPLVKGSQRASFENKVKEHQSDFTIKTRNLRGELIVSEKKDYYTPVTYISPYSINKIAQGFDLSSNSVRRTSLEYARNTGKMTTTAKIKLVQDQDNSYGFLIVAPVYQQGIIPTNLQERISALVGYVTGVYRVNSLMINAQQQAKKEGLELRLFDLDKSDGGLLYGQNNNRSTFSFDLVIPDRDWRLDISLNEKMKKSIDSPPIFYWILSVGTLVSLLLAISIYALQTSHHKSLKILALSKRLQFHNKKLEQTVDERTQELENKNSELKLNVEELTEQRKTLSNLIKESQKAKIIAEQHAQKLARSNRDLDDFAYIASHDLKAPLRGIDQLASWVSEDIQDGNFEEVFANVAMMRSRVQRLETLLNDLLSYSRVNRKNYKLTTVDCNKLFNEIFTLISAPSGFSIVSNNTLPIFLTASTPFEQIILNLLNNAVKHHDKSEGQIIIQCEDQGDFYLFKIKDDGPGINQNHYDEIFKMFRTLKPRDETEGSGMGLALVKKIIEYYAGKVYVESTVGEGCTFCFTWPKAIAVESNI